MKCLRCQTDMKQYKIDKNFGVYGAEHKEMSIGPICQTSHNPKSIYLCDNCGYMELSRNECISKDI